MAILNGEFAHVPLPAVREVLRQKKKLYTAYLTLAQHESPHINSSKPYENLSRPRKPISPDQLLNNPLVAELNAAKRKAERDLGMFSFFLPFHLHSLTFSSVKTPLVVRRNKSMPKNSTRRSANEEAQWPSASAVMQMFPPTE